MPAPADSLPSNYRFADVTLDVTRRCVTRRGQPIELKALDFDLLRFLVEQAPNVVNADALAEKVWGRHFVSPENVAQRVMLLRQSLSDDANKPRYIETVRNKGYRLIPVVESVAAEAASATPQYRRWAIPAIAAALSVAVGVTAATNYWLGETTKQAPRPSSIAVLPFENLSTDPDDAYFAAGMQDMVVNRLTKLSALDVFPVSPGAGAQRSIAELGRELNVATVLSGSVQYAEGQVLVSTHLSDAASGQSLWSESYKRELSDIFKIQSDIALELAQALRIELSPEERERIERGQTTNPRARDLYLVARGRDPLSADVLLALTEVEQALDLDPGFVEAWAYDSLLRNYAQFIDPARADLHRQRSELAAYRAIHLDPKFGQAHNVLGWLLASKKEWTRAEAAFRTAAELNVPSGSLGSYAWLQLDAGQFGVRAREIFEAARAADPQNALYYRALAFVHEGRGEFARANEFYDWGLRLLPTDSLQRRALLNQRMHWLLGRGELTRAGAIESVDPLDAAMLASLDDPKHALEQLHREHAAALADKPNPNRQRDIGLWAGHFGDPALAFNAMRAAIDEQGGQMVYVWLPQLRAMRALSEFRAYMREIGMVAYWEKYGWPMTFCHPLGEDDFECT